MSRGDHLDKRDGTAGGERGGTEDGGRGMAGLTSSPPPPSGRLGAVWQLVKFNLVGLLNTGIDFVLFALLVHLGMNVIPAQCISYAAGVLNSYLFNKYWTFGDRKSAHLPQAVRFVALNAVSLGLSLLLLTLLHDRLGLHALVSKAIATVIVMGVTFTGTKLWVFRSRPVPEHGRQ